MNKKTYDEKLYLDMPFGEALERFAGTKPKEVTTSVAKSKKAKPSGGKLNKPPEGVVKSKNVIRLSSKRKPDNP